jgi:hypothetical protein
MITAILSDKFYAEYHKKEALSIPFPAILQEKFHFPFTMSSARNTDTPARIRHSRLTDTRKISSEY